MSARRRDSQEGIVRRQREDAQLRSYQSTDYEKAPVPVKMGWTAGSYTDDGAVPSSPSSRKPPTPRKDLIPPRSPSSNSSRPSSASNVSAHSQQTVQSTQERRPTSAMAQAQQLLINRPTSARDSRNAPSASYGGPQLSLAAVRKMPKDLCKEILIYMLENDHDLMNMVREFFVSAEQDDTPLDDLEQEQIPIVRPSSAASATQRPRSARPATPEAAGVLSSHHRTAPARVPTLPIPDFQAEAYRLANEQYSSRGTERSSTKYDSTPEQLVSRKKTRDTKAQPARSYEDPYADGAEAVVPQIKAPPQERRRRDTGISSPTTPDYDGHHISNPPEYRDKSLPRDGYPTSRPLMTEYDDAVSAPSTPNGRQPYVLTQELLAASLVQSRDFEYKQECPHCSRLFAEHRLQVHIKVCRSAIARPRSPFDVSTQRLEGEAAHIYKKAVAAAKASDAAVPKKRKRESKWRKDREEFLSAVYLAKSMALSGADVANQIKEALGQEQDVFVECPTCRRKFHQYAAERHVPICRAAQTRQRGSGSASVRQSQGSLASMPQQQQLQYQSQQQSHQGSSLQSQSQSQPQPRSSNSSSAASSNRNRQSPSTSRPSSVRASVSSNPALRESVSRNPATSVPSRNSSSRSSAASQHSLRS